MTDIYEIIPSMHAKANDDRIGYLIGELSAHGAGWQTLTGAELRTYRTELEGRLKDANAYGCTGDHTFSDTGCHACYLIRARAANTAGNRLVEG